MADCLKKTSQSEKKCLMKLHRENIQFLEVALFLNTAHYALNRQKK
jgi:hypothetical protein